MTVDLSKPIEIAEDIFWVGYHIPNDPFQCHVYLIRNGEESVLIDPGSMITFPVVLEKIFKITTLRNIKYIILHHQDPDIVGCFSTLESLFPEDRERFVVTHWRTKTLLKHYRWRIPFYLIDRHDFKLTAGNRELEFVFTPYAHFPGAFCTFDKKTKTLFSSDIFGSISDKFLFYAEDVPEYYEGVELFHKHYTPSKAILNYALSKIEEKQPELIAPQHGSLIRKDMIKPIINRLKLLDCGLYMVGSNAKELKVLDKIEAILKELFKVIISSSDFKVIVGRIFQSLKKEIPELNLIKVILPLEKEEKTTFIEIDVTGDESLDIKFKLHSNRPKVGGFVYKISLEHDGEDLGELFVFSEKMTKENLEFLNFLFKNVSSALSASLAKEIEHYRLEIEKDELLKKSLTDPLTGLFNRAYLFNFIQRTIQESLKVGKPFSVAIFDLDHFKRINDTYGHLTGDCVLKEFAKVLKESFRDTDCVARYGGEEFVVVLVGAKLEDACKKVEKVRKKVKELLFCEEKLKITFSAGVTEFVKGKTIKELLEKADKNLYVAKRERDKVVCS